MDRLKLSREGGRERERKERAEREGEKFDDVGKRGRHGWVEGYEGQVAD